MNPTPESPDQQQARGRKIEEIFLHAVECDPDQRRSLLSRLCGQDAGLRAEVESLLGHHDPSKAFLDSSEMLGLVSMLPGGIAGAQHMDVALPAGAKVGSYTIVSQLGSGGMGVVYIAEQDKLRRTVALKLIRRDMATPSVMRRFEHEAEILGRLQHPGIAQIFEAGTADWGYGAQPFFAMELVRGGVPLNFHADRRKMGSGERLELVAKTCDAVQHAHQRGVIHRDLKPGNVLVNELGDPKVLDFGVARLAVAEMDVTTLRTGIGQLIGTLAYMSPEQVEGDPREIDTRSDVYALGVILFELLTGTLPHDVRSRSVPEAARVIRDEPTPRLSSINRVFRGDIETIVAKALEKDKTRRYQSAADLGADLRRYLGGEAIEAKRDSALYVLRKQMRRYRGVVALASAAALILSGLGVFASFKAASEHEARLRADAEQQVAQQARQSAELATQRADAANQRSAAELRASNIERGRLLGSTGNSRWAEPALWSAYIESPDSKHAKWALWELYSHEPCLWTRRADAVKGRALVISPDGARIVTAGDEGIARVWDAASGAPVGTLDASPARILDLAYTPDGASILTIADNGPALLWNSLDFHRDASLELHDIPMTCGVFCGEYIAVGCADGGLRVWPRNGMGEPRLVHPSDPDLARGSAKLTALAVDRSNTRIAAGDEGGSAYVFSLPDFKLLWQAKPHTRALSGIAFSPDGATLATGGVDRVCQLSDAGTGKVLSTIRPSNGTVRRVVFSPDGRTLATVGWWRLDLWDVATRERIGPMNARAHGAFAGNFTPDGANLASISEDGVLRVWEVTPRKDLRRIVAHPGTSAECVTFSPDGALIASGGGDGTINLYEASSGRLSGRFLMPGLRAHSLSFSPDGLTLAAGPTVNSESGPKARVSLFDVQSKRLLLELPVDVEGISALSYSPRGETLAAVETNGRLRFWDMPLGKLRATIERAPGDGEGLGLACSLDSSMVAVVYRRKAIKVWSLADASLVASFTSPQNDVWSVAFSKDSKALAVGMWDQSIQIWDLPSNTLLRTLSGHRELVTALQFCPDRRTLISACSDGTLKLWDYRAGICVATLDAHPFDAHSVAISPDGLTIASAHADGVLALWDLTYYDRHIAGNRPYFETIFPR